MGYMLTSETPTMDMNLSKSTCWLSVLIIIGIIIFILILNDKYKRQLKYNNKSVKFSDDDEYEDNKNHNKSHCPYN